MSSIADFVRDIPDYPKPGILFRDITPLLADPAALVASIDAMVKPFVGEKIDIVAAAEARGFIFGTSIATKLNAGFVPVRKPGKLPYEVMSHTYELEYGTDELQIHTDAIPKGAKVLIVDDLLATGGTVEACIKMVEQSGGEIVGCSFLIHLLALGGEKRLVPHRVESAISYE